MFLQFPIETNIDQNCVTIYIYEDTVKTKLTVNALFIYRMTVVGGLVFR